MVTYTRQELFAYNNEAVSGGKQPQPVFDDIQHNGICSVTRGCRAGRNCNRQRTIRPLIGRRSGFRPTFTNTALTTIPLSTWNCQRLLESGVRALLNWMCIASMFVRLRTKPYQFPTLWFRGTSTFWLWRRRGWQFHRRSCHKYISSLWIRISFSVTTTWNTWRRCRSVVQVRPDSKTDTYAWQLH